MRTVGNHPLADAKEPHARADLAHRADVGIAQRQRFIELGKGRLQHRAHAIGAQPLEQQPHALGLLQSFADEAGAPELEQHALGAGGQQRGTRAHHHFVRPWLRRRQLKQLDSAAPQVLHDLARNG